MRKGEEGEMSVGGIRRDVRHCEDPLYIKIVEVEEEPEVEFVVSMEKTRLAQRKVGMIRSLLEKDKDKEKKKKTAEGSSRNTPLKPSRRNKWNELR
ncbi:hypothetical protein DRN74_03935 [Candidatus Micrarchaeota archaeon]|nr:MAG: hypothetical protein DRN74_03935 [Candidatus Micrarchaeota archaeon]